MKTEEELHQLNFAYYGEDRGKKSMQMFVSFTESIKREIPAGSMVIIVLGNGEIVGTRTISKSSGAYKSSNVYSSNFHVFFDHETASKIAANGVKKVRLAYDKKKFDWLADENQPKMLAYGIYNTRLAVFNK